jgi:hypothetical protein
MAYPDLLTAQEHKPPKGGRTSTLIDLVGGYKAANAQAASVPRNGKTAIVAPVMPEAASKTSPEATVEAQHLQALCKHCVLVVGFVRGADTRPEHVLSFYAQHYPVTDKVAVLAEIYRTRTTLIHADLIRARVDVIELTDSGKDFARTLVSMPSADPQRRYNEAYDAMLVSMGKRGRTISSVMYPPPIDDLPFRRR